MPKRTSAWALLAVALVALPVSGNADPPAYRNAACAAFDPGFTYGEDYCSSVNDAPALAAATPGGSVPEEITVRTALTGDGKTIQVVVALAVQVNPEIVWAVLNDYENMPRFVPDILATRLISVGPGRKRVEIDGVARLLFLEFPTHTTLDAVDQPDGSVAIDSVAGNLAIHGSVRVHGDGPYTRVDYQVRMTPDFWLPPLIGDFLIGRQIMRQFEGVVAEMHRRAYGHQTQRLDGSRLAGARRLAHATEIPGERTISTLKHLS